MSSGPGWSGNNRAVLNYLRVVGADQEEGKFIISGDGILSFLGIQDEDADVIVAYDTMYYVNGKAASLAVGLRSTSSGVGVMVIC